LVVDDDPEFLDYASSLLEADVTVAATPLEAIWALEHHCFDAVICDLVFRDVDGRHLLALVRERWPGTGCVLVTGFGGRLTDASPTLVVLKPCDFDELNRALAVAAGRRVNDRPAHPGAAWGLSRPSSIS
jgi:CheY-like chemotaxis protein